MHVYIQPITIIFIAVDGTGPFLLIMQFSWYYWPFNNLWKSINIKYYNYNIQCMCKAYLFPNVISAIQIYDFHTFTVIYAPYSHNACYNKAIRIPVRMVWKNLIGCTRLTLSKISNHHSSKTIKVHILQ